MNRAKQIFVSVLLVAVCFALTLTAAAMRIGTVVDYVLATDIRAFIEGYEIPAMNIGGKLGVVAEDLRGYGFSVIWNADARTLSITRNDSAEFSPASISQKKYRVGRRLAAVRYTDIVTYLEGNVVESFNINGRTVIYFSALENHGTLLYDNDARFSLLSFDEKVWEERTVQTLPEKIIHAGGTIHMKVGSNSLEALNRTYSLGHRFIELDFVLSSDGIPVCLHDWSDFYSDGLSDMPITAAEFSKVKIFNAYTPLTLDDLAAWMKTHTDAYIVTDIKEDNVNVLRQIVKKHPEIMSRLIPQIYQYDEYASVRAMGYSNIVLTLYQLPTYEDKMNSKYNASFAKKRGILAVTADVTLVNKRFVNAYTAAGVPLLVHTVNNAEEQAALRAMGVTGFYTDVAE